MQKKMSNVLRIAKRTNMKGIKSLMEINKISLINHLILLNKNNRKMKMNNNRIEIKMIANLQYLRVNLKILLKK